MSAPLTDVDLRRLRKCCDNPMYSFNNEAVAEFIDEIVKLREENNRRKSAMKDAIQFIEDDMPTDEVLGALRRVS